MYGTLKNASGAALDVPDFGVVLAIAEALDLDEPDDLHRIRLSLDIETALVDGDLEVYDTTPTLVPVEGLELWIQDRLNTRPRFEAYNTADSDAYTTGVMAVRPLNVTSIESCCMALAPSSTHVDINFDGAIDIHAEVSVAADSGSGISGIEMWLEKNGVFVPGTLRGTVLHAGEVQSVVMGRSSLDVVNEDEISVVAQRTSGSLAWRYPASGCRLRIRRVE